MDKIPPYINQENLHTCSLAVLRMVLARHGIAVSEAELVGRVVKEYGKNFKNLWNPTIAKLAREYKTHTVMYTTMSIQKRNDERGGSLAHKEMLRAVALGCRYVYGKLTAARIKSATAKGHVVQTSVKLHTLYPGEKHVFHSILVYNVEGDTVSYHDPAYGESLHCTMKILLKASDNAGAAMIYSGQD